LRRDARARRRRAQRGASARYAARRARDGDASACNAHSAACLRAQTLTLTLFTPRLFRRHFRFAYFDYFAC
jgi:hypothetical protein